MRNTLTYDGMSFENNSIKAAEISVDTSLNERVLDVDTMHATVKSTQSLVPYQQNVPVRFLRGGSQYALWYLRSVTRIGPDMWDLSLMSSLGRLTQMPHKGGIYNGVAASAIIDDICGVVPHFVGAAFQNVLLYGWLPYVAPSGENGAQTGSAKDNLLKVLFALNATVRDDADGTLRIENLSTAVSGQLDADRIYRDNASVVTEPTVTAVTVLEHQYITGSETTTLFEGTTVDGQVIVFREPMSNLTATGFTVTESNANYAVVSAGSGTLTGTPYIHTTREITKPVTAASIPNAVRIEDATLVGVTNSSEVVNRLVDYYSHRTYITVDATIDFEDAGDVVEIYDPFDKVLRQACIEKISPLVVSQTMKGRVSALVGFTPWQVIPFEDARELLIGSGTWTVPEGVTEVTAVLIGGGSGGNSGAAGQSVIVTSRTYTNATSGSFSGAPAGNGGAGGDGGSGGNIYRAEIDVTPGSSVSFACGAGGAASTAGTDTVFGTRTSGEGSPLASGFVDPITGTIYGAKGKNGETGGNGGSAGSAGENVGSHYGGSGLASKSISANFLENKGSGRASLSGCGGGGAGAPGGNAPSTGSNGSTGSSGNYRIFGNVSYVGDQAYIRAMNQYVTYMAGGRGGDGGQGAAATVYGCGGSGGGGGGGAGATGSTSCSASPASGVILSASGNSLTVYNDGGAWSSGGAGGSGGAGAPGCIILYYRRPVTE